MVLSSPILHPPRLRPRRKDFSGGAAGLCGEILERLQMSQSRGIGRRAMTTRVEVQSDMKGPDTKAGI